MAPKAARCCDGSNVAITASEAARPSWVTSAQPRRRPSQGGAYASRNGDQRNFTV
jgi:hypothetical protein